MSLNIKHAKKSSGIPPLEAGTYAAVCCGVVDLGIQASSFDGQKREQQKILIMWELPGETISTEQGELPRVLSKRFTFSLHEMSSLRATLKSWRGRDFTDTELGDFDLKNIIGAGCMIATSISERGGRSYTDVDSVSRLIKGMKAQQPTRTLHFDLDVAETWKTFAKLPEWVQKCINDSLTLKEKGLAFDPETGACVDMNNDVSDDAPPQFYDADYIEDDNVPF